MFKILKLLVTLLLILPLSVWAATVPGTVSIPADQELPTDGQVISLNGKWTLITEEPANNFEVRVPGAWQTQGPGMSFHGKGVYEKTFYAPTLQKNQRLWLHFDNVMSHAEVTLNGKAIGSHIGGWTAFEFDITDSTQPTNTLQVRVDEMPNHFTTGFIKCIQGSFGGIWGDVWIEARPAAFIKDMFVTPDVKRSIAALHIEIHNPKALPTGAVIVAESSAGSAEIKVASLDAQGRSRVIVPIKNQKLWSPESPFLYEMRVSVISSAGEVIDSDSIKFGMRSFECAGNKLLLNGEPIYIAGIVHWGIYPQFLTPSCTKEQFRKEIKSLKTAGFNAIIVCLFMPPERFYDVADEEGIILWQEYPYWTNFPNANRPSSEGEKEKFITEYKEMFKRDRRHTSVLLRSLTLENHDIDEKLMGRLFDLAHEMIPNSVIQDNSTDLRQVFADFVDYHPYVEVNAWKNTLASLINVVNDKYPDKPFLFGECFDSDTFRDIPAIVKHYGKDRPWWMLAEYANGSSHLGGSVGGGDFWGHEIFVKKLTEEIGIRAVKKITENSYKHAMASRKYMIEQARLYDCFAGLGVTGLRDNKATRPGVYDDLGNLKFPLAHLKLLNSPTLPIIDTEPQSRCYIASEAAMIKSYISHYGKADIENASLKLTLSGMVQSFKNLSIKKGTVLNLGQWTPTMPDVKKPTQFELKAELETSGETIVNTWPIWVFPKIEPTPATNITIHDPAKLLTDLPITGISPTEKIMIASVFDQAVTAYLNAGGKVLLIDSAAAALPSHDSAFWREVAVERYSEKVFGSFPFDGWVDLQFFDLSTLKAYDPNPNHKPLFRTINCRHLQQNDLIIEKPYGNGWLIATTLTLTGQTNTTGQSLLKNIVGYLADL